MTNTIQLFLEDQVFLIIPQDQNKEANFTLHLTREAPRVNLIMQNRKKQLLVILTKQKMKLFLRNPLALQKNTVDRVYIQASL